MADRRQLEQRLEELREELRTVEGGPTEVYSRIVGYYRSVRNWNAGKRSEYAARRNFALPSLGAEFSASLAPSGAVEGESAPAARAEIGSDPASEVLVFTRRTCPNCPPVANFVRDSGLAASFVDVDGEAGLELARRYGVLATPTVLGLDCRGRELFRACDLGSLRAAISADDAARRSPELAGMAVG